MPWGFFLTTKAHFFNNKTIKHYKERVMSEVSVIISLIGGIVGILAYVVKISMDYQRIKSRIDQNEKRDEEERRENALKFNELYNSRNKTNETLTELTTTVKMLVSNINQQFTSLDKKIDELRGNK